MWCFSFLFFFCKHTLNVPPDCGTALWDCSPAIVGFHMRTIGSLWGLVHETERDKQLTMVTAVSPACSPHPLPQHKNVWPDSWLDRKSQSAPNQSKLNFSKVKTGNYTAVFNAVERTLKMYTKRYTKMKWIGRQSIWPPIGPSPLLSHKTEEGGVRRAFPGSEGV